MSDPVHTQYDPATLQVAPHALPAVRAAFEEAAHLLDQHLGEMGYAGYLRQGWMGDPGSEHLRTYYNANVMEAPDGPFQAMNKYLDTLHAIRDQLAAAEAEYRRVEGDNADLWGRA
jgi:uncharacterized protein YukE